MTIFMKQYGRTILYVVFAAAVFGMIFGTQVGEHTGFVQAAYQKANEDRTDRDVTVYTDVDAVKKVIARKNPEITFSYQKTLPGIPADLGRMFLAKDEEGNPVTVEITDILDGMGDSILFLTEEDRNQKKYICDPASFVFSKTGIYTIKVKAADREQKTSYQEYKLPVTSH